MTNRGPLARCILALAVSLCAPAVAAAQTLPGPQQPAAIVFGPYDKGPLPLTPESYQEAIDCGFRSSYPDCVGNYGVCQLSSLFVTVGTPFSAVAADAFEDKRQLRKPQPRPTTLKTLNSQGATFIVGASSSFTLANSVTRVVIDRNGQRFEPTVQEVQPVVIANGFGATRTVNRGLFQFPLEVLRPGADLNVSIAVESGFPVTCKITDAELKRMR